MKTRKETSPSLFTSTESLMEGKKVRVLASATVTALVILLVILYLCFKFSKDFYITASLTLAAILVILVWVVLHYAPRSRRQTVDQSLHLQRADEPRVEYSFLRKVAGLPTKFPFEVLAAATDNFQALLGRGSSGSVFKGILDDGTPIAVKRIEGAEHGEKEFHAEIAAIASVQHVNLVRLLGYCLIAGGPHYLVYEFVHNGSLDSWIFPRKDNLVQNDPRLCLPWAVRYRVAIDVAKALAYLHHDCRSRILHLDIKPENILLNESFRALIADFGLSTLMGRDESRVVETVRGTRGYLAPEWLLDGGISDKSDVHSYGMVALELVGGRRSVQLVGDGEDRKWSYLPRILAQKEREGRMMEAVDERIVGEVDEREVRTLLFVGLWCIQEKAEMRPSMSRVVDMLEGRMAVVAPPETEMVIVDLMSIMEKDSTGETSAGFQSESQHQAGSSYSYAVSALSGR